MYLPRCNFSLSTREPAMATRTNMRGLKTDTNNGPLNLTHQAVNTTAIPEATTPYISKLLQHYI